MGLIKTYNWWRHVGHDYSVIKSLYLVYICDIRPVLLTPYYIIYLRYNTYLIRRMERKFKKKSGTNLR